MKEIVYAYHALSVYELQLDFSRVMADSLVWLNRQRHSPPSYPQVLNFKMIFLFLCYCFFLLFIVMYDVILTCIIYR